MHGNSFLENVLLFFCRDGSCLRDYLSNSIFVHLEMLVYMSYLDWVLWHYKNKQIYPLQHPVVYLQISSTHDLSINQ